MKVEICRGNKQCDLQEKKKKKKDLMVDPWCLAVEPAPGMGLG